MMIARRIKRILNDTGLYRRYRRYRLLNNLHQWTETDARLQAFYKSFILPGGLCFDVGANIGNRTKIFLALGSRVVAVEPQQFCIQLLQSRFSRESRFTLVPAALGEQVGSADMRVSSAHTVSSMNTHWIDRVRSSGRFADIQWNKRIEVPLTTLDRLIEDMGTPDFIKIDVEGYEAFVLRGLSRPVAAVSIEYTAEFTDSSVTCIHHLASLGSYELNLSKGESLAFVFDRWIAPDDMIAYLRSLDLSLYNWGDIYFRLKSSAPASEQFSSKDE